MKKEYIAEHSCVLDRFHENSRLLTALQKKQFYLELIPFLLELHEWEKMTYIREMLSIISHKTLQEPEK